MMTAVVPGVLVKGKYQLERELARGGMGALWVAYDRDLRRRVAIKFLNMMTIDYADACARFEREALSTAQVRSPNVVQTYDYGIYKGLPYMVLELLEGEDLSVRLHRDGRLNLASAQAIVCQVLRGLMAVHAAGIVHRDLKPANIFLARAGDEQLVKLLDFGVARIATVEMPLDSSKEGRLLGTPRYMSPEQANDSQSVDGRSDLWSVGVVFYRMITGEHAFSNGGEMSFREARQIRRAVPPSRLVPGLPADIDAFITKALACDPKDRFQSAAQMLEALTRLDAGDLDSRRRAITARMKSFPDVAPASGEPSATPASESPPTQRSRDSAPTVSERKPKVEVVPAPSIEAYAAAIRDSEVTVKIQARDAAPSARAVNSGVAVEPWSFDDSAPESEEPARTTMLPPRPTHERLFEISLKRHNRVPNLPLLGSLQEEGGAERRTEEPFLLVTRKAPPRAPDTSPSVVGLVAITLALIAATSACLYGADLRNVPASTADVR